LSLYVVAVLVLMEGVARYVDVASGAVGASTGRAKKLWMVAAQGTLHLYQSWKDEAPKQSVDLVLCSVKR